MSVVLIVNNENEAQRLIPWAKLLSPDDTTGIRVIIAQEKEGPREWEAYKLRESDAAEVEAVASDESSTPDLNAATRVLAGLEEGEAPADTTEAEVTGVEITAHRLRDPAPDAAIQELLPSFHATLVIVPLDEMAHESEKEWKGRLFRSVSCEIIYLRSSAAETPVAHRILVPTAGGPNAAAALRRAESITSTAGQGEAAALFVQDGDDELASEIGERILDRHVRSAVGGRKSENVERRVVLGDNMMDGIEEALNASPQGYDLIMIGAYRHRTIRNVFFGKLANDCFSGEDAPAFAAVRASMPLGTRFQQFCERQVQQFVPQLGRESRVDLVERVQTSSNWDFDFIALICLSTCIAALGLVGNQSSVVIGAMLVAPLMTPLAAAGLALVQGNGALIKRALRSVVFGFLLAYVIGMVVGLVMPLGKEIPPELIARTSPRFADLIVALFGGVAAAYAMSRPHLSSALPGVAIAAALVPPTATSGIMLANGQWAFARGSLLLFLTNIVAIILGTAISLRLVGVRDAHRHGQSQRWSRKFAALLLAAVIALGFMVSYKAPRTGAVAIDELKMKIDDVVKDAASEASVVSAITTGESLLTVVLESPNDDLGDVPQLIHNLAVDHFADENLQLKLEVRHVVQINNLVDKSAETDDEVNNEEISDADLLLPPSEDSGEVDGNATNETNENPRE